MDLSERSCAAVPIPPPDYLDCLATKAAADKRADVSKPPSTFKPPASGPDTASPVSRAVRSIRAAACGAGASPASLGSLQFSRRFRKEGVRLKGVT